MSDKGLLNKIYEELLKVNSKNINNPIKKCAKDLNRHLSKVATRLVNKPMKDRSTSCPYVTATLNNNETPLHTRENGQN